MRRALLLDDDPSFIISAQKFFPKDTEWLATMDLDKAEKLVDLMAFDVIIARKKNETALRNLIYRRIQKIDTENDNPYKKLVVLPRILWKKSLKRIH